MSQRSRPRLPASRRQQKTRCPRQIRPIIIGIGGGTGAGKTTLARRLALLHADLGSVVLRSGLLYRDRRAWPPNSGR